MVHGGAKVSKREVRIPISDCPWCGMERVSLRDYLCFHVKRTSCHELFRAFQGKASLALREFQGSRVETEEDWKEYILSFVNKVTTDERMKRKYGELMEQIHEYQEEYGGEYTDFFAFLVRLYVARGHLKFVGEFAETMMRQCLMCSANLSEETRSEICGKCQASVGQPEGSHDQSPGPSRPSEPVPTKRIGMATANRRR
ncbi:MAG: hypothetical protein ABIH23_28940 [bacterium]